MIFLRLPLIIACLSLPVFAASSTATSPAAASATQEQAEVASTPPSSTAQELYSAAQSDLLQIRVLLKNGHSQSAVGSGFLIGTSNLVITNFHVVSQIALEPETYLGEFKDTQGKSGDIELLAVDVQHDLAVLRVNRQGTGFFNLIETPAALNQGEHLYSLGNPLDLGFFISEGTYNGLSHRGFSDQIMFTGPVNPGMSGGPNVKANGQVAGINVAHRRDGELVSFLVPAAFAQKLVASITDASKPPEDFKPIIGEQLLAHQTIMMNTLLATPLTVKTLGPYSVPVRESEQVRCWGNSDSKREKTYKTDQINCRMESEIFVSNDLQTGQISINHKFMQTDQLNSLRFTNLAGKFFNNRVNSNTKDEDITTSHCKEEFINKDDFSSRAVVCVEAYKKFAGLYNFTLFTTTTDEPLMNLQSRLDIDGVSFENGQKFVSQFLAGFIKTKPLIVNKNSAASSNRNSFSASSISTLNDKKEAK
jgi:S1-C subfamily serine protease